MQHFKDYDELHYHNDVSNFLNDYFPGIWTGLVGMAQHSSRSPDLIFLWVLLMGCYEENCLVQKIQTKNFILLWCHSSNISTENMQFCLMSLLTHIDGGGSGGYL